MTGIIGIAMIVGGLLAASFGLACIVGSFIHWGNPSDEGGSDYANDNPEVRIVAHRVPVP